MKQIATLKETTFINKYERVIAISDVHGDYDGFINTLAKVKFSDKDALVIVGDFLEKGKQSLQLLLYLYQLDKQDNVFVLKGNNDALLVEWFDNDFNDEQLYEYIAMRYEDIDYSLIGNIINKHNLKYESYKDLKDIKQFIKDNYYYLVEYLRNLDDILDSDVATFVHAGLDDSKPLDKQDYVYVITVDYYLIRSEVRHNKPVVVGHWPVSNYSYDKITTQTAYNNKNNVFSIDGGNSMKTWGQINALVFNLKESKIEYINYDNLPLIKLKQDNITNDNYLTLIFPNTQLQVINQTDTQSFCHLIGPNVDVTLNNDDIYVWKNKYYCMDYSDYYLPVKQGDIVSLVSIDENYDYITIKKENVIGRYKGQYEYIKSSLDNELK